MTGIIGLLFFVIGAVLTLSAVEPESMRKEQVTTPAPVAGRITSGVLGIGALGFAGYKLADWAATHHLHVLLSMAGD